MPEPVQGNRVVALTGATGFVGGHILRQLVNAGHRVRVLARNPDKLPAELADQDIVVGALDDKSALARLSTGADAFIHCAGSVRGVTKSQFAAVNVDGSAACAHAAVRHRVARFLLISSLAAREPQLSAYAASKRGGEEAVLEATADADIELTILRPPAVYGPDDKEMLPIFQMMARGLAPVLGRRDARFSLIHVDDLASAAVNWLACEDLPREILELDDGKPGGYGWDDVCDIVTSITKRPIHRIPLPKALLVLPAGLNSLAGTLTSYTPMFSLGKLRELRHPDWVCRASDGRGLHSWQPQFRLREGLATTPGWRAQGDPGSNH